MWMGHSNSAMQRSHLPFNSNSLTHRLKSMVSLLLKKAINMLLMAGRHGTNEKTYGI
jgi:hypothetical protein